MLQIYDNNKIRRRRDIIDKRLSPSRIEAQHTHEANNNRDLTVIRALPICICMSIYLATQSVWRGTTISLDDAARVYIVVSVRRRRRGCTQKEPRSVHMGCVCVRGR